MAEQYSVECGILDLDCVSLIAMASELPELTVYSRMGCHLCEDMLDALYAYRDELGFDMTIYNIDDDPELLEMFTESVPSVFLGEREIMRYYFELATLEQALAALK